MTRGGHVYTPGSASAWKERIHWEAKKTCPCPVGDKETPVRVDIEFYLKRPKRLCRKKDPPHRIYATRKPDRDNLDKAVLDSLVGAGVLLDDNQVVSGLIEKFYHPIGEGPSVLIRISIPWEGLDGT
jgi:Holliday junction resolvase RusA-like endonuclease